MKHLFLLFCCLSLFACAKPAETGLVTKEFALQLVETRINDENDKQDELLQQMGTLNPKELALLKGYIKEILNQDPPITTSITMTWVAYWLIYKIDDMLGTLEYTSLIEGTFGEMLSTLVGTADFEFITDTGEKIIVFDTAATLRLQYPDEVLYNETQKVRLYIKEEPMTHSLRRQVLKIEIITDNAPR